jgi:hypothetical protein
MTRDGSGTQLIRVAKKEVHSTGDELIQERFVQEVGYADYFACLMGEMTGLGKASLGVIEDESGQGAFSFAQGGAVVNGIMTPRVRPLHKLLEELTADD